MSKQYTDLFVDFDDTLYDTRGSAEKSLEELYEVCHLGEHFDKPNDFFTSYWQWNTTLWRQYAKGEIERDKLMVERFRQPLLTGRYEQVTREMCMDISDTFLDLCCKNASLIEGAKDLLDHLKGRGYRLHMCSNGFSEVQYRKLKNTQLENYFDNVILSENAGANKPNPVFFEYALAQTKAQKDTTLMIGDNYDTDIVGASNSGLDTLLFKRWDKNFRPTGPVTYMVDTLAEIKTIL